MRTRTRTATRATAATAGPSGPAHVHPGRGGALLRGTVVTPDVAFDGAVLVEGDRISARAGALCDAHPSAAAASVIVTCGVIAPGFVDTHNHVLFDVFDTSDWNPGRLFQNHDQWTSDARYQALLDVKQCLANDSQGKPTWCAQTPYGTAAGGLRCEMDKVGRAPRTRRRDDEHGGTAGHVVGLLLEPRPLRRRDPERARPGQDPYERHVPAVRRHRDEALCAGYAADTVDAFLVHVGEGIDARSRNEFRRSRGSRTGA